MEWRFICSKLPNTCLFFTWKEGESTKNKLMGRFIYRKLLLLVELVALDKSHEATRLFYRAQRRNNMFTHLNEHVCLKIEVSGDLFTCVYVFVCAHPCSVDEITHAEQHWGDVLKLNKSLSIITELLSLSYPSLSFCLCHLMNSWPGHLQKNPICVYNKGTKYDRG